MTPSTAIRNPTPATISQKSISIRATLPTPKAIDFKPGALLGSVSGELGLRKYLESNGHTFVVTSDKDGPRSRFERELPDADVVISQPFWPAYLTAERIAKAKKLKLAVTAGIGSDHVDLQAAIDRKITVAEVTYSNSISVAEQGRGRLAKCFCQPKRAGWHFCPAWPNAVLRSSKLFCPACKLDGTFAKKAFTLQQKSLSLFTRIYGRSSSS
jgi:hypothetical protein